MPKPIERRIEALEARDPGNRVVVLFERPTDAELAEHGQQGAQVLVVTFVPSTTDLEQQP